MSGSFPHRPGLGKNVAPGEQNAQCAKHPRDQFYNIEVVCFSVLRNHLSKQLHNNSNVCGWRLELDGGSKICGTGVHHWAESRRYLHL